jgi:hypothetical protein
MDMPLCPLMTQSGHRSIQVVIRPFRAAVWVQCVGGGVSHSQTTTLREAVTASCNRLWVDTPRW